MSNRSPLLLSLALLLPCSLACEGSNLDPDEEVAVTGELRSSGGEAEADRSVVLIRIPDPVELITEGLVIIDSIGLVCLRPDPPNLCETARFTDTDDEGAYGYELRGEDTQGSFGQAVPFMVAANDADSASVTASMIINVPELEVPSLRFWHPTLTVEDVEAGRAVTSSALHNDIEETAESYEIALDTETGTAWQSTGRSSPDVTWGPELYADYEGQVRITASRSASASDTDFSLTHQSPPASFSAGELTPKSRGASCSVAVDGADQALSDPCPVTDADLSTRFEPQGDPCSGDDCEETSDIWLTLHLPEEAVISQVVVRGRTALSAGVVVEVRSGEEWSEVASGGADDESFFHLSFPEVSTTELRIKTSDTKEKLGAMAEVDVF